MAETNVDKEQTPCNDFDENFELEEQLLNNFEKVLEIIQEDAFLEQVDETFKETIPGIKKSLKERMEDLKKRDCGIVVVGETGTGKSTLINKLIGHDALAYGALETTGRIYRVKHWEKMRVKTYRSGCGEPNEHSFNSVQELHEMLTVLEEEDTQDDTIYQVDVSLPFSKIKNGNVTIVDTPGIGDDNDLKEMLDSYIPKAVAFVIVIDVSRAGGLQRDRILSVLKTIEDSASAMQCFDLDDTLFVRNKWDCVDVGRQKRDKMKMILTDRMKAAFPWVSKNRIFDICLKKDLKDDFSEYRSQFEEFEDAIHELIKTKENIRIQNHGTYLSDVILAATKVLSEAMAEFKKLTEINDITFQNLEDIMIKTKETIKTLHSAKEKIVMTITGKIISCLYDYIHSEELSTLILQEEPKLETFYKMQIDGIIHERMEKATKKWLEENVPKIVRTEFEIIIQDITDNYEKILKMCRKFQGIAENELNLSLKEEGVIWTVLSGIVWASNKYFWAFFLDQEAVAFVSTFWFVSTLSLGALMIAKPIFNVEEVIKESFQSRVKTMNKEKLLELLQKKLDKGLREFHRHIFTTTLPNAVDSMSYCVDLMKRKKTKIEQKQNDLKELLTKMDHCQKDVDKMIRHWQG